MEFRYQPPSDEEDFEVFCERLLRDLWPGSEPQRYGRRGQRQHGVDIADLTGTEPLRCAQCKWKGVGKFLEPEELESEVTNALGFTPPIGKYFVLTTAPRSAELQKKLMELNQAHQKAGKFQIILWTWDRFEEYLRENPGAWDRYIDPPIRRAIEPLREDVRLLAQMMDRLTASVGDDEIGQKLEQAWQLLEKWDFIAAEIALRQLETNRWSELSNDQKFLLITYYGKCAWQRGKWTDAGKRYLEAKKYQSDSERALINEALGYELLADRSRAYSLGRDLLKRFPASPRLWALIIRSAPPEVSAVLLESELPSEAVADSEVMVGLAMRAQHERRWKDSERFARQAVSADPHWSTAKLLLGQAKARLLAAEGWVTENDPLVTKDQTAVRETLDLFDEAVELARKTGPRTLADSLVERGRAKGLLLPGLHDEDFEEALTLAPDDIAVQLRCGEHYLFTDRTAIALPLLRKHYSSTGSQESAFLTALALREIDYEGNQVEWMAILRNSAIDGSASFHIQAASIAIAYYCRKEQTKEALELVDAMSSSPVVKDCCRVWIACAQGNRTQAKAHAESALNGLEETAASDIAKLVADALIRVEEHERALPLLERVAVSRRNIHAALDLVRTAMKVQDVASVRRVCRDWRSAGVMNLDLIDAELGVLERFAPQEAFALLKELVEQLPSDKVIRFRLARLALELDKPQFICRDVDLLPSAEESSVQLGVEIVHYLVDVKEHGAALRFSYDFLRRNQKEAAAHHTLAYAVIGSQPPEEAFEIPEVVGVDAAFTFEEEGADKARTYVISNGEEPAFKDDLNCEHGLARRVEGLKTGDGFLISGDDIDGRKAKIAEVTSKYVHRARQALAEWELMFPESPAIESVRMGEPKGEPGKEILDFVPMLRRVHARQRIVDERFDAYRQHTATVHMLAASISQPPFEVLGWLAASPEKGVRCGNGGLGTFDEAKQLTASSPRIVLDLISIATLDLLELLEAVLDSPLDFVVTSNTIQELRAVRDVRKDRGANSGHLSPTDAGIGLAFKEISPEQLASSVERIEKVLASVIARTECVDVPDVIEMEGKDRERAVGALGLHGLECALLAKMQGWVLMTDDLAVSLWSEHLFGDRSRIWCQPLLASLAANGHIPTTDFHSATAKLVGYGFTGIYLDAESIVVAAELADWNPVNWPLKECLDALGRLSDPKATAVMAARVIRRILTKPIRLSNDALVVMAILDRVASTVLGVAAVVSIERRVDVLFGLDVQAAYEARQIITEWRSLRVR